MTLLAASCCCNVLLRTCTLFKSKPFFSVQPGLTEVKRRALSNSVLDVNTNVSKDVLLYKNDNDVPVEETDEDLPWYKKVNLGSTVIRYSFTGVCLIVGNGLLVTAFLFTTRAVKYIILKKGGRRVDLITFLPLLGRDKLLNVAVNEVSANESRASARVTIPLKVKGKSLYYLIDMQGKFGNLRLFDATVGLRRIIK